MLLAVVAIVFGLALLVWSADRFIDGAAATAHYLGVPTLLIGMVIIGFGTSAPELVVSAFAAASGNPGLALGNAYGSNIANIGLVIGLVALIAPIDVHSSVVRRELPILLMITLLAGWQLLDGNLGRLDAFILLLVFFGVMGWSVLQARKQPEDIIGGSTGAELEALHLTQRQALFWLILGLVVLIVSSRVLVWGAVSVAQGLGVSDLIIGLTVVAIGTSLPELASSVAAIRKQEHDLALGNIVGSGLFNTLAVVGLAAAIHPLQPDPEVLFRDWSLMAAMTVALLIMGIGWRGRRGRINRWEGGTLLMVYAIYMVYLTQTALLANH